MEILESRQLKRQAQRRLADASYNPSRLALIHTGIALACSLVLTVIHYLLSRQVSGTGGLEGIGTRSVLQSAQSILSLMLSVGMPFWEFGFVAAAMGFARREKVAIRDLTRGFRRFGPILRLLLLQMMLYTLVALLATQLASMVILLTPLGNGAMVLMETLSQDAQFLETGVLPDAMLMPLLQALIPVYIAAGVLFAVVAIPLGYRLRLARYMLLEGDQPRALAAMLGSSHIMRGNCTDYFKLDLSFWWYWLLQALCSALVFGDSLLALVGVKLPVDGEAAVFLFYGLQLVASLLLAWRWRAPVETTYALAYDTLTGRLKTEPQEQ